MLMEYLAIPYEQQIYTADNRPKWFEDDKIKMKAKNPAANLPFLIDGDDIICETDAIMIYLVHKANRLDMLGKNMKEQVSLSTAMGIFKDLYNKFIDLTYYGK